MITLRKIHRLAIAKSKIIYTPEIKVSGLIDYKKWVQYINDNQDIFIWYENTTNGKNILAKIDELPDDFKESTLILLNKVRCFADFNKKKNIYNMSFGCSENDSEWVAISFNKIPNIKDLKLCLNMANYLDALLLYNHTKIIDEKVIESLE
jgi:hypothetical protein